MAIELELKLAVDDVQLLDTILSDADLRSRMDAPYHYIKMATTYFDTRDGRLSRRKWTLRMRQENERHVVTFKTPGQGYARGEWECESPYVEDAIPALLRHGAPDELQALVAGQELLPVCSAEFTRITAALQLSGCVCELAADAGNLLGNGKSQPLCELELELKDGSAELMLAYGAALAEKYGLHEQLRSKFARAFALTQT